MLHCLATGLVVKVARQLLPTASAPAIAGALFAAHPIHTEAVAGNVGRADLAACNFYLLTFLAYCKHIEWRSSNDLRCWGTLIGTIALAAGAMLCKETAITALIFCALYDLIRAFNGYHDKVRIQYLFFFFFFHFSFYPSVLTKHRANTRSRFRIFPASHPINQHNWTCIDDNHSIASFVARTDGSIFNRRQSHRQINVVVDPISNVCIFAGIQF